MSLTAKLKHEMWDREWAEGAHCIPPLAYQPAYRVIPALYPNVCGRCLGTGTFMVTHNGLLGWACVWCDRGEVDPWTNATDNKDSRDG